MRYSRFDELSGLYDVFEDTKGHPINGDLAVPNLSSQVVRNIGVSGREAGRRLPSNAKLVGRSWHPQGVIVPSVRGGRGVLSGLSGPTDGAMGLFWIGAGAIAGGLMGAIKDNVAGGVVAGGLLGLGAYHFRRSGGHT